MLQFYDKFNEVRELTKQQLAPPSHINGSGGGGDATDSKPSMQPNAAAVQNVRSIYSPLFLTGYSVLRV